MPRPRLRRRISFNPKTNYFKPRGIPMRILQVVNLTKEEVEAYRLRYVDGLDQNESAKKMNTSQSTFQRILTKASEKIADAIVHGKALQIEDN